MKGLLLMLLLGSAVLCAAVATEKEEAWLFDDSDEDPFEDEEDPEDSELEQSDDDDTGDESAEDDESEDSDLEEQQHTESRMVQASDIAELKNQINRARSLLSKRKQEVLAADGDYQDTLDARIETGELEEDEARDLAQKHHAKTRKTLDSIKQQLVSVSDLEQQLVSLRSRLAQQGSKDTAETEAKKKELQRGLDSLKQKFVHAEKVLKSRIKQSAVFQGARIMAKKVNKLFKAETKKIAKKFKKDSPEYRAEKTKAANKIKNTAAYKSHARLVNTARNMYHTAAHQLATSYQSQQKQLVRNVMGKHKKKANGKKE